MILQTAVAPFSSTLTAVFIAIFSVRGSLKSRLSVLTVASLALFVPCWMVTAQDTQSTIKVMHEPPSPNAIPPLGSLMQIKLELQNTTDITTKIRLIGSKDGRFIDINLPRGVLNDKDRPTFTVELPAPVAAMTYQFIVHQPNGGLTTSERFLLKRSCIQTFKVAPQEAGSTAAYEQEVSILVAKAKSLERDAISLEASFKILEEIQTAVTR